MAKSQRIYWCTWLLCIRWHNESTDFLNRIFLDTRWPTIVHSYIALDGTMHLLAHMVSGLSLGFFVWGECSPPMAKYIFWCKWLCCIKWHKASYGVYVYIALDASSILN